MSHLARLGLRSPNYDKTPLLRVPASHARECWRGWDALVAVLADRLPRRGRSILAVECYPGVDETRVREELAARLAPALVFPTRPVFKTPAEIASLTAPFLGGDDPVFGYLNQTLGLEDFCDPARAEALRARLRVAEGLVFVVGAGASLLAPEADLLVYADLPRWEGQLRQRRGEVENLGADNRGEKASLQYKRSFFVDWRVADRLKRRTMTRWDYLLDTTHNEDPKLISGAAHLAALAFATTTPFRLVPFFDPGPWGGQWMREVCDLPDGPPNYAWCFDCVPEENSLLLEFHGGVRVEIPSLNLVFHRPVELLGEPVHGRFGAEFPIRFDFLDTMGGGNLSLQVHPTVDYAREKFGLSYTQDESYYLLDAEPGAKVYLGCRDGVDTRALFAELETANAGGAPFDAGRHAASFPARAHDHFLIPAGTLHCSGAGAMVLEISATPYIFTFKLWDWARLGLDGRPRPVNLARGAEVLLPERNETYAREHLVNRLEPLDSGPGWRAERTGLHPAQFIETRRHWFTGPVRNDTGGAARGGVHVLNLVQGEAAVVESPTGAFAPFEVHYAETFVIPAAVGAYVIRPLEAKPTRELATLQAFVRSNS